MLPRFFQVFRYGFSLLTLNKETARHFSSKDGLFWDQQRIAVQSLQPWRAKCKSQHGKGRRIISWGLKEVGSAVANKELAAFHWLSERT